MAHGESAAGAPAILDEVKPAVLPRAVLVGTTGASTGSPRRSAELWRPKPRSGGGGALAAGRFRRLLQPSPAFPTSSPPHRSLGPSHTDQLGLADRQFRLLDRHRPCRDTDFGHPLPAAAEVADLDQPGGGGDDDLRRGLRRHLSVFHVGRVWYAWFLFPLPNYNYIWRNSARPWNGMFSPSSTYGTVSVLFWYVGMVPDLATLRDRFAIAGRRLRAQDYGVMAMGWRGSARAWSNYEMAYLILAGISTPLVLSVHTIVLLRFRGLAHPRLAYDDFPALLRGRRDILRLRHGTDPGAAAARGLQAGGPGHPVPHRLHVQDHFGDGTMVGYAYAMEFFIAWYGANPFEGFTFINRAFGPIPGPTG